MSLKSTIEYLGEWEMLYNPNFKEVEFDPLLAEAGRTGNSDKQLKRVRMIEQSGI